MVAGDVNYCSMRERTMSDTAAKSANRCHDFAFNPIDAFGENEKGYKPRSPVKPKKKQCEGQISFFKEYVHEDGNINGNTDKY